MKKYCRQVTQKEFDEAFEKARERYNRLKNAIKELDEQTSCQN